MTVPVNPAVVTPAPAAAAPQPAIPAVPASAVPSKPAVTPAPAQGSQTVPVAALIDERDKRQLAEKSLNDIRLEMDALKKVVGQNVYFDANGHPVASIPQPAPQNDYQKQVDQLWETDPRKAVQAEIFQAMSWFENSQATLDEQIEELETSFPDFKDHRKQTRAYLRMLPLEQRSREGVAKMAYFAVRGQNLDPAKIREQVEAEVMARLNGGQGAGGLPVGAVGNPSIPAGAVTLTEDERKVCQVMGIPETEYVKHRTSRSA